MPTTIDTDCDCYGVGCDFCADGPDWGLMTRALRRLVMFCKPSPANGPVVSRG